MLEMLREMGWIVVEIEELNRLAWVDDDAGVILVRPGLCSADLSRLTDLALLHPDRAPCPE